MDPVFIFLLATFPYLIRAEPQNPTSHITVIGSVYCDVCYDNTFSKYSYFLPGVDVHVQCKFKAKSPGTTEQIAFTVNRITNKFGMYKLDISSVDGVDCAEEGSIQTFCQASLIGSSISACNVPGLKTASVSSISSATSAASVASIPPLPPLPFPKPPSLPFPFPPLPPFTPTPTQLSPPPPHAFNLGDPRTWIPNNPLLPPPPPEFNLGDPRTWIPKNPLLSSPPPPTFNFQDPRTWLPHIPTSPPTNPNSHIP
ncbi:unnamed protein product [Fraxinus pennsylvanica]|uniref:Uncharacterized protein n=1 Tax=Fraxinus pennsylvanica TaxID=56036 RepID=A0AAD1ZG70_9LAMI|nr:unnamed protein product [Fraxinus pennsylvanica]